MCDKMFGLSNGTVILSSDKYKCMIMFGILHSQTQLDMKIALEYVIVAQLLNPNPTLGQSD